MQDAVLITLGREMAAYAEAFNRDRWRIYKCEERLRVINLGGTASGAAFYETACADGGSGWVVKTAGAGYVADSLIPCATASGDLACKLPTNVKK